jgi:hypothetical protein
MEEIAADPIPTCAAEILLATDDQNTVPSTEVVTCVPRYEVAMINTCRRPPGLCLKVPLREISRVGSASETAAPPILTGPVPKSDREWPLVSAIDGPRSKGRIVYFG